MTKLHTCILMFCFILMLTSCSYNNSSSQNQQPTSTQRGLLKIKVINPTNEPILWCRIDFIDEEEQFEFEGIEPRGEIEVEIEDAIFPPDFKIKWRVKQSSGEDWMGFTNRYRYRGEYSPVWDAEKAGFKIVFMDPPSETTGVQE